MFIPILLASLASPTVFIDDSRPSYMICEEMDYELRQGVEFDIITDDQADALTLRCLINYSSGPSTHYPYL